MGRGAIKIVANPRGVQGVLRSFIAADAALPGDTLEAQRELGRRSEIAFGAHVPVKSGRALRGIGSGLLGAVVTVTDYARNPQSGYDYIGVTRWGHGKIEPKHRGFGAQVIATKRRRGGETLTHGYDSFQSPSALRFSVGGSVVYAKYVREWRPASDWAEDALPEVQAQAQIVASRLGHRIEARF
jgi:hypothetical protein